MIRTWHIERAVVAAILSIGAACSAHDWRAWLSAAAVLASFAHGQIADRLAEREAARRNPGVECHRKALTYFVAKEALWVAFFLSTGAYPALIGCALFLLYPVWRRFWRSRFPLLAVVAAFAQCPTCRCALRMGETCACCAGNADFEIEPFL